MGLLLGFLFCSILFFFLIIFLSRYELTVVFLLAKFELSRRNLNVLCCSMYLIFEISGAGVWLPCFGT